MTTTSPTMTQVGTEPTSSRFSRLTDAAARLRTRAAGGQLDRWMLVIGGLLMPLGGLLIILGWVGASRTPLVFEQNAYLISGGILGLALVIAGGFTYFGYWQTIRIRESREQSELLINTLNRLETLLGAGGTSAGNAANGAGPRMVATANGSIFHRSDCTVVSGRDDLTNVNPDKTKLQPCRICTPLASAR